MKPNLFATYILCFVIYFSMTTSNAQVYDAVIAQDGSGDYTSIQRAIDRLRGNSSGRYLFFIKKGIYNEKVNLLVDNMSFIGEAVDDVIITWDDYSGDSEGNSTSSSYSFQADGDGFYAENITFKNTAGNVGQAVAVSATGSQQVFKNCKFYGFQDTYYIKKGMQYHLNCYIEGATDFIFGEATSVFDQCEIKCLNGGQYITAPADTKLITVANGQNFYHGTLFIDSEITRANGVADNSYFLGRPWQPNSSSVYINCTLGNHIKPEGWSEWSNNNHLSAHFSEFGSVNPDGSPVDVSNRVSWSSQLTSQEVDDYYNLDYFLNGWDPLPIVQVLDAPDNLSQVTIFSQGSFELIWPEVIGAIGYVLYKNDSTYAFTSELQFSVDDLITGDKIQVSAVNNYGSPGKRSAEFVVPVVNSIKDELGISFKLIENTIVFSEQVNFKIFSMSGQLVLSQTSTTEHQISHLPKGVYVLGVENSRGITAFEKIAL